MRSFTDQILGQMICYFNRIFDFFYLTELKQAVIVDFHLPLEFTLFWAPENLSAEYLLYPPTAGLGA